MRKETIVSGCTLLRSFHSYPPVFLLKIFNVPLAIIASMIIFPALLNGQIAGKSRLLKMASIYNSGTDQYFTLFKPGDSTTSIYKHPLIIQMGGAGQVGGFTFAPNDIGDYCSKGASMQFYNATYGHNSTFYVIVPHKPSGGVGYWEPFRVKDVYSWAVANLADLDTTQVYVTGLSLGGGGTWGFMADSLYWCNRIAAAAPITGTQDAMDATLFGNVGTSHLPFWAWEDTDDANMPTAGTTQHYQLAENIYYSSIVPRGRYTYPTSGGHTGTWPKAYDTGHATYTVDSSSFSHGSSVTYVNNPNLYEWFLQQSRPAAPVTAPDCSINSSPADASTIDSASSVTLTWNSSARATSYDIYFWSGSTAPSSATYNTTSLSYVVTGLTASTVYHWYIVPKNSAGSASGCSSSATVFTTASVVAGPGPGNIRLQSMPSIYGTGTTSFHLFTPYDSASTDKHPLIIQMDGSGELNNTNIAHYSPGWNGSQGASMRFYNSSYARYSTFYVLVPHHYGGSSVWPTYYVKDMLAWAKANLGSVIDTTQIYVIGLDYGGGGVYSVISDSIKYANTFAAAGSFVGTSNVDKDTLFTHIRDSHLPLWIWQATNDTFSISVVPSLALQAYQGAHYSTNVPQTRFTLTDYGGHTMWSIGYDTGHTSFPVDSSFYAGHSNYATYVNNPNFYEWLLSKRRVNADTVALAGSSTLKSMTSVYGTGTTYFHLYTPGDSVISPYKHPLIIQMDGSGEHNNNNIANYSPAWNGSHGASMRFYNATYAHYSTFYIMTPHNYGGTLNWPTYYVKDMLAWAKANLSSVIDTTQIYMTGLDYGGGGVYSVIADSIRYANTFAAALTFVGTSNVNKDTLLTHISNAQLPLWVWQATNDTFSISVVPSLALLAYQQSNYPSITPQVRFTLPDYGGHTIWSSGYDTGHQSFTVDSSYFSGHGNYATYLNNPNIYEWFLTKSRMGGSGMRLMPTSAIPFLLPPEKSVPVDQKESVLLFTNPIRHGQPARILINTNSSGSALAQLTAISGAQLLMQRISVAKGSNTLLVNTGNLPAGLYMIKIVGIGRSLYTLKLIVK